MLNIISRIAGRPWMVSADFVAEVRGLMAKEGYAALRHFARLKEAAHAYDDDEHPRAPTAAARVRASAEAQGVAVIPVVGMMTQRGDVVNSVETRSTDDVAAEVRAAALHPHVGAILLDFDTPGGEVYGVPEAFAAIREVGKQKPVVAVAHSVTASAGLYLATAANEFFVTPSGEVGSLGVYALHVDESRALDEKYMERWEFIVADDSPHKVEGNPTGPLSDDARAQLKKVVNRYMRMFVGDVARGRGVSVEHVRENFGKGRMLSPQEAVSVKMADSVGTFDDALARALSLAKANREGARGARAEESAPSVTTSKLRAELAQVAAGQPTP